jgi:RimJ/RimL family protein N-acetyltransferase
LDDLSYPVVRVLRDGATRLNIRPITPADRDELRRAFQASSARTRYLRFMGVMRELSDEMLDYLTNVDGKDHVALVATVTSPDMKSERGVGVARFIRMKDEPHVAEGAITVVDDMQSKGVGTALAFELERAARANDIRAMRADVLEANETMRTILEAAGAKKLPAEDPGVVSYEIALEPDEPPPFPERLLTRLLRAAAQFDPSP